MSYTKFKYGKEHPGIWATWTAKYLLVFWLSLTALVGGSITGIVFGANQISRQVSVESCHNWGLTNDRQTKWASYNLFSYDCLTKSYDGKWVSTQYPQQFIPLYVNTKSGEK